uniref:AMP-dependent synthetase/ligase domain-containing protein n=1 Tax=Bionectria ochroleuca TaxID=29856 RepID=A0A8H7TP78_BIOOC
MSGAAAWTGRGAPTVAFASANTFSWLFSNPFEEESDFTPSQQRVPRVEDGRPLFVDEANGHILTKAQLRRDALSLASSLQSLHGLDPHDLQSLPPSPNCHRPEVAPVVLIQLPNCLPFPSLLLGTLAASLTATLVSPALASKEIGWILQTARPRVIITSTTCLPAMEAAIRSQKDRLFFDSVTVYTVDVAGETYPSPVPIAEKQEKEKGRDKNKDKDKETKNSWRRLLTASRHHVSTPGRFDPATRAALILWSSGTSGRSKGVLLSHQSLNFSVTSLWHDADFYLRKRQRWLGFVPFFHVYGLLNLLLLAIPTGSTVYTLPAFKLETVLAAIPRLQITYLVLAPPVAVALAKSPIVEPYAKRDSRGRNRFSSVIAGVTGGAPLGHDIIAQVFARLGFRIRMGYGLTEAGNWPAALGVEVMIATHVPGERGLLPAEIGEPGELSGPSPTAEALTPHGWLRTGDVGTINLDGSIRLTDRIKELIKVRGFQVPPAEIEAVICSSDEVADAGVAAVYDAERATEWPRAFVVAAVRTQTHSELKALAYRLRDLVEAHTARYKRLRGGIVFVDQIPKSPSGKILRRMMKEGQVTGVEFQVYEPTGAPSKL